MLLQNCTSTVARPSLKISCRLSWMSYAHITIAGPRKESAQMLEKGEHWQRPIDSILACGGARSSVSSWSTHTVNTQKSIHYQSIRFHCLRHSISQCEKYMEKERCFPRLVPRRHLLRTNKFPSSPTVWGTASLESESHTCCPFFTV
jgi:hypothetical protein